MNIASSEQIRVLHVDDNPDFVETAAIFLEQEHSRLTVETETDPTDAVDRLTEEIDCIVSDYEMPDTTGIEFLETVRASFPDLPFILFTGKGGEEVAADAISAGVTDYLQKERGTDQYSILANRIANAVTAHQSVAAAEQRRYRLEQILKTVPSCVVQVDTDGTVVFANRRTNDVLDVTQERLTGNLYTDTDWEIEDLDGCPISDSDHPFRQVIQSGEPLNNAEYMMTAPDGTQKILSVNGVPLYDDDGDVESIVCSLSDITTRKEREQHLQRQNEQLQEFANIVSHDLRNPLQVARGQLTIAQQTGDDEAFETGQQALDRIEAIIEDVLTLARQGQRVGETRLTDIGTIAREAWETADTETTTLRVIGQCQIEADPNRLQQLFENLFRNAMEHAGPDVTITVGPIDPVPTATRTANENVNGFYIADDGSGIPADHQEQVFDSGFTTAEAGTGFGLAIVSQIAEAHGWEISVTESRKGGARFEIIDSPSVGR